MQMSQLSTSKNAQVLALQDARKDLSDVISKAAFANESTIITRSGKKAAAVISYKDYERFRQLEEIYRQVEDQHDGQLATERLAQGNKRYSLEELDKELGL